MKYLIGCSPLGAIAFLSNAWGGFISNNLHFPGDQILADRRFTLQDDFAASCSAELLIPAFTKNKSQLFGRDVEITHQIAAVQIHIERLIGLLKSRYSILDGPILLSMVKSWTNEIADDVPNIDKLVTVCSALVHLGTGIVQKGNQQ